MNIDCSNYKVVSKYFAGKTVMDESLEFQEKKSFKGPKNAKTTAIKPKAKKVKRIKGQKDIRTALKPKKSDLIAYSKDFDLVCKKSGIDVDSEQLQLAIALSKSLQPSESDDGPSTSALTTQQRTGLIRSTLKEYGFKVPDAKLNCNRKIKKRRKPYKLLITAVEEKQQIISDRYSQLLFELNCSESASDNLNVDFSDLFIYNMSTNIEYKDIKDDDVFYVEDLIEKSPNTMGCLLKKWSDIPGRLQSPTQVKSEIIFSEIECSQDEIDIVLSGSLKSSKAILSKRNLYKRKSKDCSIINEDTDKDDQNQIHVIEEKYNSSPAFEIVSSGENTSETKDNPVEVIDVPDKLLLSVPQTYRSLSPDLFTDDDEVTLIESNIEVEPAKLVSNVITETTVVMDLTECVNATSQKCKNNSMTIKPLSQLSQETDKTKRKSNDFMEITGCVGGSQPILEKIDEHIDLTAAPCNNIGTEENIINIDQVEHMDLTQSSNTSTDSLPFVFISGKDKDPVNNKSLNDTIILDEKEYVVAKSPVVNSDENIVDIVNDKLESHSSQFANIPKNEIILKSPVKSSVEDKQSSIICLDESHEVNIEKDSIDLTQTSDAIIPMDPTTVSTDIRVNNSSLGKKDNISVDYDEALENMNSNSYCAYDISFDAANDAEVDNNLENKQNDKSVHSEMLELPEKEMNIPSKNDADSNFGLGGISVIDYLPSFSSKSRITIDNVPNGSIMSESLPLVYVKSVTSPVKAKSPFNEFLNPVLDSVNDNELNTNNAGNTEPKQASKPQTPVKRAEKQVNVETPKQTEYIVKTDNVTPMLDYAAMTSPERNKELDKYGLKPFKRKRAIQLLTHLYNQTHPYVESTEELPSPSKKRKRDNLSQPSTSKSPKKTSKSPKNTSNSPRKVPEDSGNSNVSDKENDMFMVTRETPVVRHIECGADDWVFQKKEKAKLQACRLPLHIAFHNFVSCRKKLHEAILRYEPVRIDVIHRELAASGHRYDPKDLLKFMDKKCITVKTADNAKNKNRY